MFKKFSILKRIKPSFFKVGTGNDPQNDMLELVCHQLRSQITAIRWYTEDMQPKDPDLSHKIDIIRQYVDQMNDLIDTFLVASKLENKGFKYSEKNINLVEFVENLISELKPLTIENNVQIEIVLDPKIEFILHDPVLLKIIIQNLLQNAIKYTKPNTKVTLKVLESGNNTEFRIADQGYGIPKSEQIKIFEKSYRIDKNKQIDGNGLGLYLVKLVAKQTGGNIKIESSENLGTVFTIIWKK